ncbi:UNKNOWN [Stylonychia lemnae]|uniref:Phosphoglycerate mutase family protein n=1 Tax=Stylonychia lemnae TaxID=5949 RepID=A0A078A4U4_STYLE|nr:UNKNOWN [Stylonychia lemnae]|eukprot:CDW77202.1 UNKNOWN [Stylonychia lemnae]
MMIRHGQRADRHPEYKVHIQVWVDAPLTPLGLQQAKETGQFLKEYINANNFEEVILESSPWLRVMMTAAQIAKELGMNKFNVSYNYRELMTPQCFDYEDPMPQLLFVNKTMDYISQKYLEGIQYVETDDSKVMDKSCMYPETEDEAFHRIKVLQKQLAKHHKKSDKKVLHLILTHYHPVYILSKINRGRNNNFSYCCKSSIKIQDGVVKRLNFDIDDSHEITQEYQPCQIIMIRHGERADKHPERNVEIEEIVDAPLTPIGIQQAYETGLFMKQYINEHQFEEVILESSPFLRVMMTASQIAKQLDKDRINVNYDFREWCDGEYYSNENPLPKLLIRRKDHADLEQQFLEGVKIDEVISPDQLNPDQLFPEPDTLVEKRVRDLTEKLTLKYAESQKKVCHIIVTHGHLVKLMALANGGQEQRYIYCSKTALEVHNGKIKSLLFDSDDSHVITKY